MGFLKSNHHGEQDFELNLASIIDCFTVLITYLLVSASFIALGVLDVSIIGPPSASQETPPPPPSEQLSVFLAKDGSMVFKASGKERLTNTIPLNGGGPDYAGLSAHIKTAKERWPEIDSIQLGASENVPYSALVKTVETLKEQIPSVAIGDPDVD